MHSYSCGPLQLPGRAPSYAKPTFELAVIGEYLQKKKKRHSLERELAQKLVRKKQSRTCVPRTTGQNMQTPFEEKPIHIVSFPFFLSLYHAS